MRFDSRLYTDLDKNDIEYKNVVFIKKYLRFLPLCDILYVHEGVFILVKKGVFYEKNKKFLGWSKKGIRDG